MVATESPSAVSVVSAAVDDVFKVSSPLVNPKSSTSSSEPSNGPCTVSDANLVLVFVVVVVVVAIGGFMVEAEW